MNLTVVKPSGKVPFVDLDEETQDDVVIGIKVVTGDFKDHIRIRLENGSVLPLVKVDPLEISDPNQNISEGRAEDYADAMRDGAKFPPIIIDSSKGQVAALIEGRHRTEGAILARKKRILAIDLAGIQIGTWLGDQIYVFPR